MAGKALLRRPSFNMIKQSYSKQEVAVKPRKDFLFPDM